MAEDKKKGNSQHKKRSSDTNYKRREPAHDGSGNDHQPPKKKNKEVAIFGNYKNYYGYRVGKDTDEDPRLSAMKKEWFEGKDCLDIGCNSGVITISIAKKFGCRSMLGIDIDGARIEEANRTLRSEVRKVNRKVTPTTQSSGDAALANVSKERANARDSSLEEQNDLLKIVSFQKGNFVQHWRAPENTRYHAISCLSVSKWIHLNWGDDGLINLFRSVWTLLQPGGVFILEPQPWSSYNKNRLVSETAAANYKTIEIPPEDFQDVLLDKIGFRIVENLTPSMSGTKAGFDRPLLAFWK